ACASAAGALQDEARALQISALDRIPRRPAEDRDRENPTLQAARGEWRKVTPFACPVPHVMKKNPLGRTGLQISEIAFGGGVTGGILIAADEPTRQAALARAVAGGINWIDTAAL